MFFGRGVAAAQIELCDVRILAHAGHAGEGAALGLGPGLVGIEHGDRGAAAMRRVDPPYGLAGEPDRAETMLIGNREQQPLRLAADVEHQAAGVHHLEMTGEQPLRIISKEREREDIPTIEAGSNVRGVQQLDTREVSSLAARPDHQNSPAAARTASRALMPPVTPMRPASLPQYCCHSETVAVCR
jgi:hypothetical protein